MKEKNTENENKKKSNVYDVFDTHKFFYTLNHNKDIEGLKVYFINKSGIETSIILTKIEIGTSPVSCNLFDNEGNRYRTPFLKIRKVTKNDELMWDNTDIDLTNIKTIPAYK